MIDMGPLRRELFQQVLPAGKRFEDLTPEERQRLAAEVNQRLLGIQQGLQIGAAELQKRAIEAEQEAAEAKALQQLDTSFLDFETLDAMGAVIVGDPERCIERVRRYQAAGCDQLLCLMQPYAIPPAKVMRSIELFGQHVIPAFR